MARRAQRKRKRYPPPTSPARTITSTNGPEQPVWRRWFASLVSWLRAVRLVCAVILFATGHAGPPSAADWTASCTVSSTHR
jgi:hypothetical protein